MNITCRQLVELLIDFVSGELDEEQREYVEQHLQKCPPCVTYLETYQITIQITRQLPPAPLPPQLVERLRAALEENCRKQPPKGGSCPFDA
jgi:anti-sigma factor RsiW